MSLHSSWRALGKMHYGPTKAEEASMQYLQALYIVRNLRTRGVLTAEDLRAISPGLGLPAKWLDHVPGKPVHRAVSRGTPLTFDRLHD